MKILKGAEVSAKIREEVAQIAAGLQEVPKLAIIRVGENPDDMSYERGATKKNGSIWPESGVLSFSGRYFRW